MTVGRARIGASRSMLVALAIFGICGTGRSEPPQPDHTKVPGVVIDHSPASSGRYIGSPSMAILPSGDYVASHDIFGPKSGRRRGATTVVFSSTDRGNSWHEIAQIQPLFWAKLFMHRGSLYILGVTHGYGDLVIRRSRDGGKTWTEPTGPTTGLLTRGAHHHCAPCPVLVHNGRLWRSVEEKADIAMPWGGFRALVVSASEDANLLDASNWTFSSRLDANKRWLNGRSFAWLEGNVVPTPEGRVGNILRVNTPRDEKAAVVRISQDGLRASFDPKKDFIDFPGGAKKFTIHYDPISRHYWSLVNYVRPQDAKRANAWNIRNVLALSSSPDLKTWTMHTILLEHTDIEKVGFQYADWEVEGEDIVAVVRTGYDDGLGGAHRAHDANYLTFHRFKDFRGKLSSRVQTGK